MGGPGLEELRECFEGLRSPRGRRWIVYLLLSLVPPGYTVTYGVLAKLAGTSPRAVGVYMKTNKCLIVIPCHRVVSAQGLGGFSRGLEFKERLLRLEGALSEDGLRVIRSVDEFWRLVEENGGGVGCDEDLWG